MHELVAKRFRQIAPRAEFASLRLVDTRQELISVRDDVLLPMQTELDLGAMITVIEGGGLGYAATSDLSTSGLERAARRALDWAKLSAGRMVVDLSKVEMPHPRGVYESKVEIPWESVPLPEKVDLLLRVSASAKQSELVVSRELYLGHLRLHTLYLTKDGGEVRQTLHLLVPEIEVTANRGAESQTRTLGRLGYCRQGGFEIVSDIGYAKRAPIIAGEALELLDAENCPSGKMDLILAPDQMLIQIHESIGHPLELDRIMGDERNYAGTSFVTPDMFGAYRYGSELLNVSFDPIEGQFATYAFDDDGLEAKRELIIEKGRLVRLLGGTISQARAGLPGVANSRASNWNRPPIDRMANLNVEPGESTFEELVSRVERGVFMRTNRSWSIDDSRNKFQFGCEWARLIENGELGPVVKNPNYRGISANFWRSLEGVGNKDTVELLGTPYCGKGEPNQAMFVGHASPVCLFGDVEVFGGEQ